MPFVVMEWVEGGSLRDLARRPPAPAHRVVRIGREICEGLAYIHSRGVLHLDIKPGNVLLDSSDSVKLTDFGIARHLGDEHGATVMAGTPKYAAPEQLRRGAHVDQRSDVYSLGAVLYLLLTGDLPEQTGRSLRYLDPRLLEALGPVLMKALRRDPEQRFASAASFGTALAEHLPSYMNEGDTDANTLQGGLR
jgi:serine/threonine-protein kinase